MKERIAMLAVAAAGTIGGIGAGSASASAEQQPAAQVESREGARCVAAGVKFLAKNGLLADAARRQIDYSTLADPESGPIFTTLPPGSFLSLGQVIRLHYTNPSLFAWCR
jgi:hypothetical protein